MISVSAHRGGDEWVFPVTDNGIGIESRCFEKICAIFQRLHSEEEYPGTGIGLAVFERIVDRHGGRIWAESGTARESTGLTEF